MSSQLITFQIGEQFLGVDIMAIREIRAWSPTTLLPHVPDYVRGVINLRGTVLPVIDLAARLGWGLTAPPGRPVIDRTSAVWGKGVPERVDTRGLHNIIK